MGERRPLNARVDEEVIDDFREFTEESTGQIRGEMGRLVERALIEYMDNDRAARIERKVDDLHELMEDTLSERDLERETKFGTSSNAVSEDTSPSASINQRTRDSINAIVAELPEDTVVSESLLESAIENHAGHAYKTLERYKTLLKNRGHILEHPLEPGQYVTSQKTFAIICENSEKITPPQLRDLIADRMELLGEEWYLDALPNELMKDNQNMKVDQVMNTQAYREDHGLLDDSIDRGVQ